MLSFLFQRALIIFEKKNNYLKQNSFFLQSNYWKNHANKIFSAMSEGIPQFIFSLHPKLEFLNIFNLQYNKKHTRHNHTNYIKILPLVGPTINFYTFKISVLFLIQSVSTNWIGVINDTKSVSNKNSSLYILTHQVLHSV